MATADQYAEWIVANEAKKGTPEFDTVAAAYREAVAEEQSAASAATAPAAPKADKGTAQNIALGALSGAADIGATILSPIDWLARKAGVSNEFVGLPEGERRRALGEFFKEHADTESLAFAGGELGTQIAGTAGVGGLLGRGVMATTKVAPSLAKFAQPLATSLETGGFKTGLTPGLPSAITRVVGGAGTGAAATGLVSPEDVGAGAVIGGALPGAVKLAGKAGRALLPDAGARAALARAAQKYGIPVAPADVWGGTLGRAMKSVIADLPLLGRIPRSQKAAAQEAYNRAIAKELGVDATQLTTEVLAKAKEGYSKLYDDLWTNNNFSYTPEFQQKIGALYGDLQNRLSDPNEIKFVHNQIEQLGEAAQQRGWQLPGDWVNNFQSKLGKVMSQPNSGAKGDVLRELRSLVRDQFRAGLPEDQIAKWQTADRLYNNYHAVKPIVEGAEVGVAGRMPGDVPAALLPQKVLQRFKGRPSSLDELAQIGSQFIADRVARTGGAPRAILQGIPAAEVVGLLTAPAVTVPAMIGTGGLGWALSSPTLTRAALNAAEVGRRAAPALTPLTQAGRRMLPAARTSPLMLLANPENATAEDQ